MTRFELGMSLDYVPHWGIVEAVREIYQNAYDEETVNKENKMFYDYDVNTETLRIGNKLSTLPTKTLLLGLSSKRDNEDTIGKHGEGYKVATIVLLREGISVRILNYNEKEIWTAKVINSRRYGEKIGVFDVEKVPIFKSVPEHNLVFELKGITQDTMDSIIESNLNMQSVKNYVSGDYGTVLLDDKYSGHIYVNGLYVCTKTQCKYGYNIVPSLIKLDRDRGLIDSFDLQWALGKVIVFTKDSKFINEIKDSWDGYYIRIYLSSLGVDLAASVYDDSYKKFKEKYGNDAYPVTTTDEYNNFKKKGLNVALVNDNTKTYITSSSYYSAPVVKTDDEDFDIVESLNDWRDKAESVLTTELLNDFDDLLEKIENNLNK